MSYIGMKKTYSTLAEVFTDICTILTTVGWTLHDELSSTNKVFKSRGEKDVYAPAYLRVYNSGSYVEFYAWQYWNLITHSGILSGYTTPSRTTYGENFIAANKDFIVCANATYSGGAAFIPNLFHTLLTTTTDSISAGSSVTIPVVSSSGFKVGNRYQILGQNYEGRERVTINSIPDSTSVVVASLATSYASGAYLGINPCPFGLWGAGAEGFHRFRPLNWYDSSGTTSNSSSQWLYFTPIIDISQNPDMFPDNYADEIHVYHVLEHLHDPLKKMEELHRILKPGGKLFLRVPHFSSLGAFTDITHIRPFGITSFDCFNETNPHHYYTKVTFKIIIKEIKYLGLYPNSGVYEKYIHKNECPVMLKPFVRGINFLIRLSPTLFERFWCYYVGGAMEINFIFEK